MPRVSDKKEAKLQERILKLAARRDGVTLPEITDKLDISRPYAVKLVGELRLPIVKTEGRANVYGSPDTLPVVDSAPTGKSGRKIELDDEPEAPAKASEPVSKDDLRALELEVAKLSASLSLKQARLSAAYAHRKPK